MGASVVENPFRKLYTRDWHGHKRKLHAVAWNSNGRRLATAGTEYVAKVWSVDSSGIATSKALELKGHSNAVDVLAWDPTHPDKLASGSLDKTVRIWDTRSGSTAAKLEVEGTMNLSWRMDGTYLAASSQEDLLTIWDVRKAKLLQQMKIEYHVNEFCWNRSGDLLLVTTAMGSIDVFAFPSMRKVDTLTAHADQAMCIDFHPSGKYFAVGGGDALVSLWDAREMICVRTFSKMEREVRSISFNSQGSYLACGGDSPSIYIFEVDSGRCVHEIPRETATDKLDWNPKYNLIAYIGDYEIKDRGVPEGGPPPRHVDGGIHVFGFENKPYQ